MESNFQFMDEKWPDLAKHGRFAELYLYTDPDTCVYKLGKLAEQLVMKLLDTKGLYYKNYTHEERIDYASDKKLIDDREIYDILHILRKERNKNVHGDAESLKAAKASLEDSYRLCCWFMKKYGGNPRFRPVPYHEPEKIVLKEKSIIERCPVCENTFVGRIAEMEEIYEKLLNNAPVYITGNRGIGKTELVKNYARRFRSEYDVICYSEFYGSLEEMIAHGELVAIRSNLVEEITIDTITELVDERTLIIIDNYSTSSGDKNSNEILYKLASLKCRLLVTTAENIQGFRSSAQIIELSELAEEEEYELFKKEYGGLLSDEEAHIAEQIISEIHGFTLLIPLIAKLLKHSSMDFQKVLERIQEAGALSLSGSISHIKDGTFYNNSITAIIQSVLNLSSLSANERFVLKCICSLDGVKIERGKLIDWIGNRYEEAINELAFKRWIAVGGTGKKSLLSVHGVICDVVNRDSSMPTDAAWIHLALKDYLDGTNHPDALIWNTGFSGGPYPTPQGRMRVEPIGGRASGFLADQNNKKRKLMETLLRSIESDQDPGDLIDILYLINGENMRRACNFAPDCDELLQRMELPETYENLTLTNRIRLHILRVYLALKSLCDREHEREEREVVYLCKTAISQSDKAIALVRDFEDSETAFRVTYDVIYNAFLACGITFGFFLFTTHDPDYSDDARHDYSEYVNLLSQRFFEDYAELFDDDIDDVLIITLQTIDYFNKCMTYDGFFELLKETLEDYNEQSSDDLDYYVNRYLSNMDSREQKIYKFAQFIGNYKKEAAESLHQCEQIGYLAMNDPEMHPEISIDLLTESANLKKAEDYLSSAKSKYTTADLLEQNWFDKIDINRTIRDYVFDDAMNPSGTRYTMRRWLSSSCIHSCCKGDLDTAKEYYTRYLNEYRSEFDSSLGLEMYHTLKHLGFTELCSDILRMEIQYYEKGIAKYEECREDSELDWLYSPERILDAVTNLMQCAELLDDKDTISKYKELKRQLETPGFEF